MINNVFIGVCCTEYDFLKYRNTIYNSIENLFLTFGENMFIYFVIQSKNIDKIKVEFSLPCDYEICYITKMGISIARNLCIIKAREKKYKYILFHDSSIYWTLSAAKFIKNNLAEGTVVKVNVIFDEIINHDFDCISRPYVVNPIYDSYVWSYALDVSVVGDLLFDESRGPGEFTYYKCGEDVLFLFSYFYKIGSFKVFTPIRGADVIHPKRELDFSKHLIYAEGQGSLFKLLIRKYNTPSLYMDLLFFFGNALWRCMLMKKNSFTILKRRVIGFIKG